MENQRLKETGDVSRVNIPELIFVAALSLVTGMMIGGVSGFGAGKTAELRQCEQRMEERKVLVAKLQDERDEALRIGRECVAQLDFALDRWGETLGLLGWTPGTSSPRVVVN